MMIPTWAGTASGTGLASACAFDWDWAPTTIDTRLDLHHFGFFVSRNLLDALDEAVGQLLEPLLGALLVLLRYATVFFCFTQMVEGIAPAITHGHARLLGALVDLLDELFAAILRQLRQHQADDLTIIGRVDAQVRRLDGFFNWTEHAPIPWLNQDHARIGGTDVGDAVDRRGGDGVVDLDAVEQSRRSSTRAKRLQIA